MTARDAKTLLREMIRIRVAEETVGRYYPEQEMRTPTHFSIGQEAISVGVCQALEHTDAAFSGHRCHAEYLAKGGSLLGMFAELYGRVDGCCKGRGGSVHLNDPSVGMIASSAILGEMIAAGVGAGWAFKMDGSDRVAVTFFGDGVTEEGITHESLNFASVMNVPVLFVCANNGLSTNTPLSVRQPKGHEIWKWAAGYGIAAEHVDGSDVFAVHEAALRAVAHMRSGKGPYFIEAPYHRTRVHVGYETDEMKNYVFRSKEAVEAGKNLDPVAKAVNKMIAAGTCTQAEVDEWTAAQVRELEDVVVQAKASPFPTVDQAARRNVLGEHCTMRTLKYNQAISEATVQCMQNDPNVFVAGIGVKDPGGIFGTTEEANELFPDRVHDIPNCENAFAGITIGAAAVGKRPLIVHPRNDFMFLSTDMLINLAAKWKYMYQNGTSVPVVTRAVVGRGWGQGATHSQSTHALFAHFPGLYVATPAFPSDIKGLMITALTGDVPVVILESRAVYGLEDEVPEQAVGIPFGKGRIIRQGADVTIVGASLMAYESLRAARILFEQHGISAEVIDPRSIRPLDEEIILNSIAKTRHLVVADTSWATYGFAAEVAAVAAEKGFADLLAPVKRVTLPDSPAPVSKPLEDAYHPTPMSIAQACLDVLKADVQVASHARDVQEAFAGPY